MRARLLLGCLLAAFSLSACGGGVVGRVTACAVDQTADLVDDLLGRILLDGGPNDTRASEPLKRYVLGLGLKHGADAVKCALKEVVTLLGTHGNPSGELRGMAAWTETPSSKEAAWRRAEDLQQMFFLAADK